MSAPRHIRLPLLPASLLPASLLLPLLSALLLSACTPDEGLVNGGIAAVPAAPVPLRLTATSGDIAATRAADGLYTSATGFDGDETVLLFLHNSSTPAVIPSAYYAVGTPDASHRSALTFVGAEDETGLYYPIEQANSGNPAVTLYGIYPDWSTETHTVESDQRTEYAYKISDLMYASTPLTWTSADDKDNARNLQFNHQLCKLKLTVVKAANVHKVDLVRMVGVKRTVAVSPSYSSAGIGTATTAGDDEGDIILLSGGEEASDTGETYQYCCIFPPQAWTAADFISIEADGGTANFRVTKTFEGGREYDLTLDLSAADLNLTATIANWEGTVDLGSDELNY